MTVGRWSNPGTGGSCRSPRRQLGRRRELASEPVLAIQPLDRHARRELENVSATSEAVRSWTGAGERPLKAPSAGEGHASDAHQLGRYSEHRRRATLVANTNGP
jgi:hypothetical protein